MIALGSEQDKGVSSVERCKATCRDKFPDCLGFDFSNNVGKLGGNCFLHFNKTTFDEVFYNNAYDHYVAVHCPGKEDVVLCSYVVFSK